MRDMTKENWRKIGEENIRKGFVRITLNYYNIRQAVVSMPNPTFIGIYQISG